MKEGKVKIHTRFQEMNEKSNGFSGRIIAKI